MIVELSTGSAVSLSNEKIIGINHDCKAVEKGRSSEITLKVFVIRACPGSEGAAVLVVAIVSSALKKQEL
ncbi:hypothetical protein RRG08_000439 [Elysia crispata]|uniref:Uncharacterized protein n=1 Tax=Elysia crispata TaxID=231223 RepID=A0AAE0YDN4_9GAST|nr:hypothetical protein RRG08_000439 [Elysia crispata]